MKIPTDVQLIHQDNLPAFAVLPYQTYLQMLQDKSDSQVYLPHQVVGLCIEQNLTLIAAWRTYLGLSQQQLAEKIGISQSAIAQIEKQGSKPQQRTLIKIAEALGLSLAQLSEN